MKGIAHMKRIQVLPLFVFLLFFTSSCSNFGERATSEAAARGDIFALCEPPSHGNRLTTSGDHIRTAIQMGADVNSRNGFSSSPLQVALGELRYGGDKKTASLDVIGALIEAGADVNVGSKYDSPLVLAIRHSNNPALIKLLIEGGAIVNNQMLWDAAGKSDPDIITQLISAGAEVNSARPSATYDRIFGESALMISSKENQNPEVITSLLGAGAAVNLMDSIHQTALILAAKHTENPEVIQRLLDGGANPHLQDFKGKTAMYYAKGNKNLHASAQYWALDTASKRSPESDVDESVLVAKSAKIEPPTSAKIEPPRFFHGDGKISATGILHTTDPDTGINLGATVTAFESTERKKGYQVSRTGEFSIYEVRPHPLAPDDSSYDQMKVLVDDKWGWISRMQFRSIELLGDAKSGLLTQEQVEKKKKPAKKIVRQEKPAKRVVMLSATQCGTITGTLVSRGRISSSDMRIIFNDISYHLDSSSRVSSSTLLRYIKKRSRNMTTTEFENLVKSVEY